jgi:excisionase family DNA binding protein
MTNKVDKDKKSEMLSCKEAADFLNLTEGRLRYEVFLKRIPYFKLGRTVRFSISDLIGWLESKKVVSNG